MARFDIAIYTDNAAFEDNPEQEVARILHKLARDLEQGRLGPSGPLFDINGNRTGDYAILQG